MKVAMIGPVYPYRGGIAHYTTHLARALVAEGYETRVISFHRQYPSWLYPGQSDRDPSNHSIRTPADFILDPFYPWTWIRATKEIAAFQPDRVVLHWWTTFWGLPFSEIARRLHHNGFPLTYIIHNVFPHEKHLWDNWLARQALQRGSRFIAQTEIEKTRLLEILPDAKVEIHPHPVYARLGGEPVPALQARRLMGLPEKETILLFFGLVRPYKGLKVLLEALAFLKVRGLKPYLVVAGEFWEDKSEYLTCIERLGIADQVRIEGRYIPNEDAHLLFSAADILAAPYVDGSQSGVASLGLGYCLPMIVTEPVASGIPPENRKLVRVVEAGNVAALAAAIENHMRCPSLARPLDYKHPEGEWRALARAVVKVA